MRGSLHPVLGLETTLRRHEGGVLLHGFETPDCALYGPAMPLQTCRAACLLSRSLTARSTLDGDTEVHL